MIVDNYAGPSLIPAPLVLNRFSCLNTICLYYCIIIIIIIIIIVIIVVIIIIIKGHVVIELNSPMIHLIA